MVYGQFVLYQLWQWVSSYPAKTDMDPHTMLAELGKGEGPAAVGGR